MVDEHFELNLPKVRPLRRVEYDRLVELGLFEGEPIELLRGALVVMSPQGPRRSWIIDLLDEALRSQVGARGRVRVQCPLALSDQDEPEPDLAVVAPGDYRDAHPTEALLVIEVAVTSLGHDLKVKAMVYALAGVPELWIVDAKGGCVHVHREPVLGVYTRVLRVARGEPLEALLTGVSVSTEAILR